MNIPQVASLIPVGKDAEALTRTLDQLSHLPRKDTPEVIVATAGDQHATERTVAGRAQLLWPE